MSKIFWTLIILAPVFLAGILATIGIDTENNLAAFNAGGAFTKWEGVVGDIVDLINSKPGVTGWDLLGTLIIAIFLTMPFIFVWKGTKIIGWIPVVGLYLRILVLVILIWIPSWSIWENIDGLEEGQMAGIAEIIILALAMWGLWIVK